MGRGRQQQALENRWVCVDCPEEAAEFETEGDASEHFRQKPTHLPIPATMLSSFRLDCCSSPFHHCPRGCVCRDCHDCS